MTQKKSLIDTILEDLYAIDPELQQHETTLRKVVKELLAAKPDITIDTHFHQQLRRMVLEKAAHLSGAQKRRPLLSQFSLPFMKKFSYFASGALVAVLIAVPALKYKNTFTTVEPVTVTPMESRAFGDLTAQQLGGGGGEKGGGGGTELTIAPQDMEWINYEYIYDGELPAVNASVPVFKKIITPFGANQNAFTNLVGDVLGNLINLETFSGMHPEFTNFTPDEKNGYNMSLNFADGSLSMGRMMDTSEDDYITLDQFPDDASLIAVTDAFVKEHGINLEGYGLGEVEHYDYDLIGPLETTGDKVPPMASVVYPLMVDGHIIYNQAGWKEGLSFSVEVTQKIVTAFWGFGTQNYESADYTGITDPAKVLELAKIGGVSNFQYANPTKTENVSLGEPTLGYVRTYIFDKEGNGNGTELFVPSYIFRITDTDFIAKNGRRVVIVPTVQELVESYLETASENVMTIETGSPELFK